MIGRFGPYLELACIAETLARPHRLRPDPFIHDPRSGITSLARGNGAAHHPLVARLTSADAFQRGAAERLLDQ
jgi:hypothetical protein